MPSIRQSTALAIGAVNTNILAGSKFEFLPNPCAIVVYAVVDAAGDALAGVNLELSMGNVVEADAIRVPREPTAGTGPDMQNHRVAAGVGAGGDRIQIRLSNQSGAAAVVRTLTEIRPL